MRIFRKNEKTTGTLPIVLTGLLVTFAMFFAYVMQPALLVRLDLKVYDLLLPQRASQEPSPIPVIIDIDEASIAEYGQWPWPRYLMADLLDTLSAYDVAAIGLDIIFAEADRSSPDMIREMLRKDKNLSFHFSGIPPEFRNYDNIFAEALQRNPAVIGAFASFAKDTGELPPPPSTGIIERSTAGATPWQKGVPQASSAILPISTLRHAAPLGFINAGHDADGILRELPLIIRVGENVYPSLSTAVLMQGLGIRNLTLQSGPYGLESVRLGNRFSVSATTQGMMRIPFIGACKTYPYYSAADVLGGRIDPQHLMGRVAFVGTSLPGLSDIRATPYDAECPGVELHAAAVDAILTGNSVSTPGWTPAAQAGLILLGGILSTLAFGFARPRIYLPIASILMVTFILLSRHLFGQGLFLSPLYGSLTVSILGAFMLLTRFWQEEQQKRRLRAIFSRYVSPEVANMVTRTAGDLLAGEEREVSIMFTDIRGFAALSEDLTPQETVTLLNLYFEPMTELVRQHNGTLDKFIGDALMAYWNAPLDVPDHPVKAVETAIAMQEAMQTVNRKLRENMNLEIRMGVGLHTGKAYVGNMGTKDYINYTLIGDNVNLASRLEGLCPKYNVGIVVSEDVRNACRDAFAFKRLDRIRVRGKYQAVTIYLPMRTGEAERRKEELAKWNEAWEKYENKDFESAQTLVTSLRKDHPDSRPYAIFADKTQRALDNPHEHDPDNPENNSLL